MGIGVDLVYIPKMKQLYLECRHTFIQHTFTSAEIHEAELRTEPWEYLASRFAVKEAVFKAVAHFTDEKRFDLRIVETQNAEDGAPIIVMNPALEQTLHNAGFSALQVSISTEKDYAAAFVVAS